MIKNITLLFLLFPFSLIAQDCICSDNLEWLIKTFSENDAGFQFVVDKKGQEAYEKHNALFRGKVKNIEEEIECSTTLYQWTQFFRSGHIGIQYSGGNQNNNENGPSEDEIREQYKDTERFVMTENEIQGSIDKIKDPNSIEGIWINGNYRIAIVKDLKNQDRDYVGFIIEADGVYWLPEQVKIEFKDKKDGTYNTKYYMRDHSVRDLESKVMGKTVLKVGDFTWERALPEFETSPEVALHMELMNSPVPMIKKLSDQTILLRIPSFGYENKKMIDSTIKANHDLIVSHPNLVIDIRYNGGGSDDSYSEIIPYLYTNPIRIVGMEMLSTPLNNDRMKRISENPDYPEEDRQWAKKMLDTLNAHLGEFVNLSGEPVTIQKMDKVLPNPQKVAIMINKGNGSTSEQFLLAAKQSEKVKLFGTTTVGVLDISNQNYIPFPCGNMNLVYCLTKSYRIPDMAIDDIGIQPDYFIDQTFEEYEWLEYVLSVMED